MQFFEMMIENELKWLKSCIDMRMAGYELSPESEIEFPEAPKVPEEGSAYAEFIIKNNLTIHERLVLALAIAPHAWPDLINGLLYKGRLSTAKLINSETKALLLPSGETALFLLSGNNLSMRLKACRFFDSDHVFYRRGVLSIRSAGNTGTQYDGELRLSQDYVESFLFNSVRRPKYSSDFPAHLLTTTLTWDDLVLNPNTEEKLQEMNDAIIHKDALQNEWGLGAHIKPGYRAIFYGPSGTGKSLTATLLGKSLNRDVYRVDLSAVISKYIGETEENISKLLSKSEDKGYILFFDEGDALFGNRSKDAQNSNDQHHNQLIAYLLQAIENYNGIIILATNMKANLDEAFSRRFQSSIFFGPPKKEQGLKIWQQLWPKQLEPDKTLDFKMLAVAKPFTAAMIVQIIQVISLRAIRSGRYKVGMNDIKQVVEELAKK
ncbi:ATP-binding protein [Marinigracilibium pacificum]|uniref:ATP-binding protein n=1 Tax=Marinigracilibium pacificum TaxID=2729599 RepID=A0A848J8V7_9BACT|nr:ATP-binding protein [Marinigracilibium pacificum]NMM50864.1 ATP-binding protein [Marinigracilibium pacificum]